MTRPIKTFHGTGIANPDVAQAVGQAHHVGQLAIYVTATSKAAAVLALKAVGVSIPASRLAVATGMQAGALHEAGQLDNPAVLATHLNGAGPVVRITAERQPVVIGELVTSNRGTTVIGDRRTPESRTRFVPAD